MMSKSEINSLFEIEIKFTEKYKLILEFSSEFVNLTISARLTEETCGHLLT